MDCHIAYRVQRGLVIHVDLLHNFLHGHGRTGILTGKENAEAGADDQGNQHNNDDNDHSNPSTGGNGGDKAFYTGDYSLHGGGNGFCSSLGSFRCGLGSSLCHLRRLFRCLCRRLSCLLRRLRCLLGSFDCDPGCLLCCLYYSLRILYRTLDSFGSLFGGMGYLTDRLFRFLNRLDGTICSSDRIPCRIRQRRSTGNIWAGRGCRMRAGCRVTGAGLIFHRRVREFVFHAFLPLRCLQRPLFPKFLDGGFPCAIHALSGVHDNVTALCCDFFHAALQLVAGIFRRRVLRVIGQILGLILGTDQTIFHAL